MRYSSGPCVLALPSESSSLKHLTPAQNTLTQSLSHYCTCVSLLTKKCQNMAKGNANFFFSTLSTQSVFTHVASSQQICCDKKKIVYQRIEFNYNRTGLGTNMAALLIYLFSICDTTMVACDRRRISCLLFGWREAKTGNRKYVCIRRLPTWRR